MPDKFVFLGRGYDTFADKRKDQLLEVEWQEYNPVSEFHYRVCETSKDIFKSLDVEAKVSVSHKGVDVEAKAKYASELSQKTNTVTILCVATQKRIGEVSSKKFKNPITSASELFARGGDSYISYVEEGGMYVASYQYDCKTEEKKTEVAAECRAKFKGVVDVDVNTKVKNVASSKNVEWTFDQKVFGSTDLGVAPSEDKIVEFATKFLKEKLDHPTILRYSTTSYYGMENCPAGFREVAEYTKAYNEKYFDKYKLSLAAISDAAKIAEARSLAVKRLYEFYHIRGDYWGGINGHLKKIDDLKKAISNFKDAFNIDSVPYPRQNVPELDLSSLDVPDLRLEFTYGPWCAGDDFHPWSDSDLSHNKGGKWQTWTGGKSWIYNFVYPRYISINVGRIIQRVKVVYVKGDSRDVEFAKADNGGWNDTSIGDCDTVLELGPGELTKFGAWWDTQDNDYPWKNKVTKLGFETNRGGNVAWVTLQSNASAGSGYRMVEKKDTSTFVGFEGCHENVWFKSPVNNWNGLATAFVNGIRAVFVDFSHTWTAQDLL